MTSEFPVALAQRNRCVCAGSPAANRRGCFTPWVLRVLWSLVIAQWASLPAQAVAPRLTNILPTGGQRGTEVQVRFMGQRLDDTQEIILYGTGISVVKLDVEKPSVVQATLRLAPDCSVGEHLMRLRSATGVSEIRTFWVDTLPNVAEVEPNNGSTNAQRIRLNSTVTGTIPGEDVDYFIVTAEKGQRLSAEIEAMRLGRGALDPFIAIQDREGKVLAGAANSTLLFPDGFVSLIAPTSGDYLIQVRETSFGGREDYHYRLHVGTFPRPVVVYPACGRTGETVNVRFIGDVSGEFKQEIELPSTPQEKFGVFAVGGSGFDGFDAGSGDGDAVANASSGGQPSSPLPPGGGAIHLAPSPNWMRVTAYPTAFEAEPNDTLEQAGQARDAPVAFNGIIGQPGDRDWFRFRARKGQSLQVRVFARRLRSPLDSVIQIVNPKGSPIADNDDAAGPDSSLTFKPDQDGDYAVVVRDQLKSGGPDFVYCLEIAPIEPSLSVKIPEVARNDTQSRQYVAVPRGNRCATLVSAKRVNFSGDVTFRLESLPAGVTLLADPMPANVDQFPLVFEAAPDAPVGGKLLDLVAAATNGVTGRYHNDLELVPGPNNTVFYGSRADKLLVAVTEPAPFNLRLVPPKVPLVQGGSMNLQVLAERAPGFDEPINVKMLWNPPGVTSLPDMTIARGSNSVSYVLNGKPDAELRAWRIAILGSAKVHDGDLYVSTQLAKLELAEPFLTAKIATCACAPGQSTNVLVKLQQKVPFEGKATIKLLGLPEKVIAPEMQITREDQEVVFPVKVDPSCPTGSHKNLFCVVAVHKDGEIIPHNVGQGGVLRIVPQKTPVVARAEKIAAKNLGGNQ